MEDQSNEAPKHQSTTGMSSTIMREWEKSEYSSIPPKQTSAQPESITANPVNYENIFSRVISRFRLKR